VLKFLRFSLSGLGGVFITASLFLGMVYLLSNAPSKQPKSDLEVLFSLVREYQMPVQKTPKKPEKPEREKVEKPPSAPSIPSIPTTHRDLMVTTNPSQQSTTPDLAEGILLPSIPGNETSDTPSNGGLKSGFAPPYPPRPLMNKVEGWLEVLIDVDERGWVDRVIVLNSKPGRMFDQTTVRTIKKWKFHPKMVNGVATPYQVKQVIEFSLDDY